MRIVLRPGQAWRVVVPPFMQPRGLADDLARAWPEDSIGGLRRRSLALVLQAIMDRATSMLERPSLRDAVKADANGASPSIAKGRDLVGMLEQRQEDRGLGLLSRALVLGGWGAMKAGSRRVLVEHALTMGCAPLALVRVSVRGPSAGKSSPGDGAHAGVVLLCRSGGLRSAPAKSPPQAETDGAEAWEAAALAIYKIQQAAEKADEGKDGETGDESSDDPWLQHISADGWSGCVASAEAARSKAGARGASVPDLSSA